LGRALEGDSEGLKGEGAGRIAAQEAPEGVAGLVQVSGLGSDETSPVDYNRTKAGGEAAVRAAFPAATIVRPSVLFGEDDAFLNLFGGLIAPDAGTLSIDGMPLVGEGRIGWRRAVAYVHQDPVLFPASIRANLLWAEPDASDTPL